ncbi:hypothetical protein CK203_036187 [Vitis vinifera]|uniref:Uncharacterized protein n=1 Tax=Vitis vinifera TaxID=29760 RepID=A0A438IX29_VITVI|nr:hypothetical protein CK203_036187 [Vitis vinifera]
MTASPVREESLPPRFGISDLPLDSGDVTLDTCDDAISYFVMDRKEGPRKAKEPQKRHVQGSDAQTGRKGGWSASGEPGGGSASPAGKTRVGSAWMSFWFGAWDKLEISSRRSLRCRKKTVAGSSPEKLPAEVDIVERFRSRVQEKRVPPDLEDKVFLLGSSMGKGLNFGSGEKEGMISNERMASLPCRRRDH